jgi:hypothetical protein
MKKPILTNVEIEQLAEAVIRGSGGRASEDMI